MIFESTGVYHKALQTYLDEHDFKYTIISPLLSAKVRKSDIRGTKTDAKDCASIAKVFYLKDLRIYSKTDEIIEIAKKFPNYEIIRSIPGLADNLASRILAEIGDIDRFNNASQLVAYVGIDPQIYQSGQISGLHLKISKKGNKKLRCLLYLAVTCMIKTNRDTKIVEFYKRKKADGLAARSALVASMNKLLRIIHSLCKNGCLFK